MRKYTDDEVWEYIQGLPAMISISMSTEGAQIVQQVVDEWRERHPDAKPDTYDEWLQRTGRQLKEQSDAGMHYENCDCSACVPDEKQKPPVGGQPN